MKSSFKIFLVISYFVTSFTGFLFSTESGGETIVLSNKVGPSIDAEERNYYKLFTGIDGFINAVFLKMPDNSNKARVEYADPETGEEKIKYIMLTRQDIERLKRYINGYIPSHEERSVEDLIGKSLALRPIVGANRRSYVNVNGFDFSYIYSRMKIFPVRTPMSVIIEKISRKGDHVEVKFSNSYLGEGIIDIYGPGDLLSMSEYLIRVLEHPFCYLSSDKGCDAIQNGYLCNIESRIIHMKGCNHEPPEDKVVCFQTLEEAETVGFNKCSICFYSVPKVTDYAIEQRMSKEISARIRYYYPVVTDVQMQKRVEDIGNRVLSNWPQTLRGYSYSFKVLEGSEPNAFACPSGKIFVTTGLLESLDYDEELEAVLAHEVTHVERRHGYRQYRSRKKATAFTAVATAVAGGIVAAKGSNVYNIDAAMEIVNLISNIASSIVLYGYSREYEKESDVFSICYLNNRYGDEGRDYHANVLKKLKYYEDQLGLFDRETTLMSTHPGLDERIAIVERSEIKTYEPPIVFVGQNSGGQDMVELTFEMENMVFGELGDSETTFKDRTYILGTVKTAHFMREEAKIKEITIHKGSEIVKYDNKEDTVIRPDFEVGFILEKSGVESLVNRDFTGIQLILPGVTRWVKVSGER